MTSKELKEQIARIDDISAQLDAIMVDINKRQDELYELWERYWKTFCKLTDEIKVGDEV